MKMELCVARICRLFWVIFVIVFNVQATPDHPTATLVILPDGEIQIVQIPPEAYASRSTIESQSSSQSQGSLRVFWRNFELDNDQQDTEQPYAISLPASNESITVDFSYDEQDMEQPYATSLSALNESTSSSFPSRWHLHPCCFMAWFVSLTFTIYAHYSERIPSSIAIFFTILTVSWGVYIFKFRCGCS